MGQIGGATAADSGKTVTNWVPTYWIRTGVASGFWPPASKTTFFQGMIVRVPGMSVAVESGWVKM